MFEQKKTKTNGHANRLTLRRISYLKLGNPLVLYAPYFGYTRKRRYYISITNKETNMTKEETQDKIAEVLDEEEVQRRFDQSKAKAKKLLEDRDKMDHFLERLEKKLKYIPVVGGVLSEIPVLIALVKAFIEKRYPDIPIGSIIAIVGALLYFLSPIDLMPDFLPVIGLVDDAAVVTLALKLVHDDVKEYKVWRDANKPS